MSLLFETLTISACMILLSGAPFFIPSLSRYSKLFFLLGTGALAGILIFDLLPDLFQLGGSSSLWAAGAVWVVYSLLHMTHLGHHEGSASSRPPSLLLFMLSMVGHCLASGAMLVASEGLALGVNRTVFLALLAHKAYEALTVSSILIERGPSRSKSLVGVVIYALSLPLGVGCTLLFRSSITQSVAVLATSLAAGTLIGCLIHDFLIPSIRHIRGRRIGLGWIALGLILTQLMMRVL